MGIATNNSAEYQALILAVKKAREIGGRNLEICMDSELIVRQMQGKYKIKDPNLKVFAEEVFVLLRNFSSVIFKHVPREQNKEADVLVNQALDSAVNP